MKIAITGHSAGIGQAFAELLADRGHEIVGLSKRHGHNIRNTPKILEHIVSCDVFINNAQAGYSQTEILYHVWEAWRGQSNKHIWCISTMMTESSSVITVPNLSDVATMAYRNQKVALEDAVKQLRDQAWLPKIILIRPGSVATQPYDQEPWPSANCREWVKTVIDYIVMADQRGLRISEVSVAAAKTPIGI